MYWCSRLLLISLLTANFLGCGKSPEKTPERHVARELGGKSLSSQELFAATLVWTETPVKAETYVQAILSFYGKDGATAESISDVEFIPTMPSMGHGTAMDEQVVQYGSSGAVTIDKVYLIMGGSWEIKVKATVNGATDTVTFKVDVQ